MINVVQVSKIYGDRTVVQGVSFSVTQGQTLVLLGTSGSGKTTTLRMINRLVEPTSGTITVDGKNINSYSPERLRRRMGYVLQNYGLFPHYTVAENIAVVPRLLRWPAEKINQRVDELLEKLALPPGQYKQAYPAHLSGGQMQRVGLARALAADPPILLMDEPFGALDPVTRRSVQKEFRELDELKTKTIILVTHDVQEAFELGDQIGLMDGGELVQIGSPLQLLLQPANAFVKNFFAPQRLQLEWQSVTLKRLWPQLAASNGVVAHHVTSNLSVWEAVEKLGSGEESIIAYDEETKTSRQLTVAGLMAALHEQKRQA